MYTDFTAEKKNIFNAMLDLVKGDYTLSDGLTKKDLEDSLRERINHDLLEGRTMYQALRRNAVDLYEIVEEIVNVAIGEGIVNNPFLNELIEFVDRRYDQTTAFYSEGGLFDVATFAGNHWDTRRQFLNEGDEVILPKEWIYVRAYDDLDRFLAGNGSLERIADKIYKSFAKYMNERMYLLLADVSNNVPSEFIASGNTEAALGTLVDKIQATGGYDSVIIAGTRGALRKLAGIVPNQYIPESQKEAKTQTGSITLWEGSTLLMVPQVIKGGTLQLNDSQLVIMGKNDNKPFKCEFFGDSRTKTDEDGSKLNDHTIDMQVQTKIATGLVCPFATGVFTIQ